MSGYKLTEITTSTQGEQKTFLEKSEYWVGGGGNAGMEEGGHWVGVGGIKEEESKLSVQQGSMPGEYYWLRGGGREVMV